MASYLGTDEVGDPIDIQVSLENVLGDVLAAEVHRRLARLESLAGATK